MPSSAQLYVGNIPHCWTAADVLGVVRGAGDAECDLKHGHAFVSFSRPVDGLAIERICESLHNTRAMGRILKLEPVKATVSRVPVQCRLCDAQTTVSAGYHGEIPMCLPCRRVVFE